jgi:hypothetical protein
MARWRSPKWSLLGHLIKLQKKGNLKECKNYRGITLVSHKVVFHSVPLVPMKLLNLNCQKLSRSLQSWEIRRCSTLMIVLLLFTVQLFGLCIIDRGKTRLPFLFFLSIDYIMRVNWRKKKRNPMDNVATTGRLRFDRRYSPHLQYTTTNARKNIPSSRNIN